MKKEKEIVRIGLTPEQKQLEPVELTVSELEERIAPSFHFQYTYTTRL